MIINDQTMRVIVVPVGLRAAVTVNGVAYDELPPFVRYGEGYANHGFAKLVHIGDTIEITESTANVVVEVNGMSIANFSAANFPIKFAVVDNVEVVTV